ncbi:MAG: phosphoenolpyruvate--protein phosphotransferase [Gammaproteobacteria bacterium]|nr:phosphoenolpyruvate--protein phosphotransferase [Gammaproteobacteria bacterium]MDX5374801.1 phosphoenolpyruvate--protein phosphotransferase [Gammaproteobacteria bacterium]
MLDTLRRIVQEVNGAEDLGQALDIIVARVKAALSVDVCSIYLTMPEREQLVLMATQGLNASAVLQVRLDYSEGLVGLVAQRAEPVNIDDAPRHPRFKYFPETGEERYHAFLGVPIIHQRRMLGVLVVQHHDEVRFDEDHVSFLVTLAAQLAGAISHAEISGGILRMRDQQLHDDLFVAGVAGSPGVGIGEAVVVYSLADLDGVPDRTPVSTADEQRHFMEAVHRVQQDMIELKERMGGLLPAEERVLFDAYVMMLGSDSLVQRTIERINEGNWAPGALRETVREYARMFEEMDDPYLRERATDLRDIGRRILTCLQSDGESERRIPERAVLVGEDVTATQLAEIPPENLVGVVSARGSGSSHVAILARAMGVPAVMGLSDLPVGRLDGREVVVDGYMGRVYVQPNPMVLREFERLAEEERELSEGLNEIANEPAVTRDGLHVPIYVNSGLISDLTPSADSGAEGIGLYRTEVPFMLRERFPGEEEQFGIYRTVLEAFAPRPVTLRTLDVGGDKALPYFPVQEDNPFLGWRGIRITLDHPEIFLSQVRAMMRASQGFNNLQVLLPMISSLSELMESQVLIERARQELLDDGVLVEMPKVGVMIEVPSAVYIADMLARRVDFLSIGTNDLVQYLLAVDRNNARVADLYHHLHPAVLRALVQVVNAAHGAGKPISVCGEMAADPEAVLLLLGMGVDSLSVSVATMPRVKWVVRSFEHERARDLLAQALQMEDPGAIRAMLNNALVEAGLGGLVRAGKI